VLERCDRAVGEVEREMLVDLEVDEVAALRGTLTRCSRALAQERVGSAAG
jgi:hypothetical protein